MRSDSLTLTFSSLDLYIPNTSCRVRFNEEVAFAVGAMAKSRGYYSHIGQQPPGLLELVNAINGCSCCSPMTVALMDKSPPGRVQSLKNMSSSLVKIPVRRLIRESPNVSSSFLTSIGRLARVLIQERHPVVRFLIIQHDSKTFRKNSIRTRQRGHQSHFNARVNTKPIYMNRPMCYTQYNRSPTCQHAWLTLIYCCQTPQQKRSNLLTCPLLNPPTGPYAPKPKEVAPSPRKRWALPYECPRCDYHGRYNKEEIRIIRMTGGGVRFGMGPARGRAGGEVGCWCSGM